MKMKKKNKLLSALVAPTLVVAGHSSVSGATTVLFDFNNGGVIGGVVVDGDPPPSDAPTGDSDFDPSNPDDTITLGGLTVTIIDVITPEFEVVGGVTQRSGMLLGGGTTSIGGQQALGLNNPTIGTGDFDLLGTTTNNGTEGTDFNADESLIFTFDQDVIFTSIELESLSGVDVFEVSLEGVTVPVLENTAQGFIDLGGLAGLTIAAGTEITFTARGDDSTTDFRIETFTVEIVPEPSSLALLGLGGLALIKRRRRG